MRKFNPFDYPEVEQLFQDLLNSLFNESGRGAILIATAQVDDHLTKLIKTVVPKNLSKTYNDKLFNYPGQLSSFSSKIELAYVFRLINKNLYNSLNALRKVRNNAAHSHLKFELHKLNEQLKSIYKLGPDLPEFIREVSSKALIQYKMDTVKKIIDTTELTDEDKIYLKRYLQTKKTLKS